MTKQERERIKTAHETLFPGLARQCRLTLQQQRDNLSAYRASAIRSREFQEGHAAAIALAETLPIY